MQSRELEYHIIDSEKIYDFLSEGPLHIHNSQRYFPLIDYLNKDNNKEYLPNKCWKHRYNLIEIDKKTYPTKSIKYYNPLYKKYGGYIHDSKNCNGIILNAAAYTHTSVGIADAVKSINCKVVEVHISNTYSREEFRHNSFLSPVVDGIIIGFGLDSYRLALESLIKDE